MMELYVRCTFCGRSVWVAAAAATREMRCGRCETERLIPASPRALAEDGGPLTQADEVAEAEWSGL